MIEIDENSYVVGMWWASDPVTNNNWLCCVQRSKTNPKCFEGHYRFRYHEDDKIFDSKDRKSWVSFVSKEDEKEEEVIKSINILQSVVALKFPEIDFIPGGGCIKKFFEIAKTKPWMHMKCEPLENYKK